MSTRSTSRVTIEQLGWYPSMGVANRLRVQTHDGRATTAHVARWPMETFAFRLVALVPPEPVERWCREHASADAVSGGFFTKPIVRALGDLVVDGHAHEREAIPEPFGSQRGTAAIDASGEIRFGRRAQFDPLEAPSLLQAGPLLVQDGEVVVEDVDPEGFSTLEEQFDSDIVVESLPRVAIATTTDDDLLALAVDGRGEGDDGLYLGELAQLLVELGARDALNLDGGSCAALVTAGVRRNQPRADDGTLFVDGYPTMSAFVVVPR